MSPRPKARKPDWESLTSLAPVPARTSQVSTGVPTKRCRSGINWRVAEPNRLAKTSSASPSSTGPATLASSSSGYVQSASAITITEPRAERIPLRMAAP